MFCRFPFSRTFRLSNIPSILSRYLLWDCWTSSRVSGCQLVHFIFPVQLHDSVVSLSTTLVKTESLQQLWCSLVQTLMKLLRMISNKSGDDPMSYFDASLRDSFNLCNSWCMSLHRPCVSLSSSFGSEWQKLFVVVFLLKMGPQICDLIRSLPLWCRNANPSPNPKKKMGLECKKLQQPQISDQTRALPFRCLNSNPATEM